MVTYQNAEYVTIDNQNAETLQQMLYDGGYGSADGNALLIYYTAGTPEVYSTEVRGVFNTGISEDAEVVWDHIWNPYYFTGGGGAEGAYSEMAAPAGFTKTSEYTWTGKDFANKYGHFNASDISAYSDLWFAMKTDAPGNIYLQGAPNNGQITGEWVYVHIHQNDDGTWTKEYRTADGYYSPATKHTGITGTKLTDLVGWKSGVNQGSYPNASEDATATAYFTEVIGVKMPFKTNIAENATKILNAPLKENSIAASETAAPEGYSSVSTFSGSWDDTNLHLGTHGDKTDLSAYSTLYFAIKVENVTIKPYGSTKYTTSAWIYFTYTKTAETTWTVNARSNDGSFNVTVEDISGAEGSSANYPLNALSTLMYGGSGDKYMTMTNNGDGVVYATEVLGVLAESAE